MTETQLPALENLSQADLERMDPKDVAILLWLAKWNKTARDKQRAPKVPWTEWGLLAGRGFGKTLTGAQWLSIESYFDPKHLPRAVIAPTLNDVRYTCFEGPAGILSLVPKQIVSDYNKTNLIITFDNGSVIRGFSAEEPERLRGPQFADVWCDELAAWMNAEATWDMMMFGLRLGPNPRVCWTSTPKPIDLVRKLVSPKEGRVIVHGTTYENRANLPQSFYDQLLQYEGTQLGRQEIEGELIDAEEGGVIARSWIQLWPAKKQLPFFEYIVMSLDTAFTERTIDKKTHNADYTACSVWGLFVYNDIPQAMLLDCWQDQLGFPNLIARVKKEMLVAYGDDEDKALIRPLIGSAKPHGSGRRPDMLLIEDKGSGISLRQALEREGVAAYAYNPGRADKLARLHMISHIPKRGQIWMPESEKYAGRPRTWAEPLLAQLCSFRGSGSIKHDDYVDSVTQAIRLLMDKNLLDMTKRSKQREDDERRQVARRPAVNPYAA